MFWALAFPMILGTLFYFTFWSLGEPDTLPWQNIPVAFVDSGQQDPQQEAFRQFIEMMDGELLEVISFDSEKEALQAMDRGEVDGIYYLDTKPRLEVASSGIKQSILESLLDTYLKNESIVMSVIDDDPEKVQDVLDGLLSSQEYIKETDLGGRTYNNNISYFLALFAFICISGAYLGLASTLASHANLSPLGIRRSVTPTSKLSLILVDLLVLSFLHFINICLLALYLRYVLGLPVPITPALFLCNFMGSILGISIGLLLGAIPGKGSHAMRTSLCIGTTLVLGFLAGLMFGDMKHIVEKNFPILNRINPAAVLSDAYYCICVYDNPGRFQRDLLILAGMCVLFITLAFISMRRERYDSL